MNVVLRPAARRDLLEHYLFIGRDSPDAAERFIAAADRTFELLAGMPEMGTRWVTENVALHGVRRHPITGFPNHLVFYRPTEDGVDILHIFHGARDIPTLLDE